MARSLRIDVEDGWYHITARGVERRVIFGDDRECEHFLELLGEMLERYGVEVHAYVLMGNHYHLLIRTPKANASRALQWLNVSYSVWHNLRRGRVGPVYQGRFKSALIDGNGSWLLIASVYLHLNPVRVKRFGLGKAGKKAEGRGYTMADKETIDKRLNALRSYRWSSYGAYTGYGEGLDWLITQGILNRGGGRKKYRQYVESYIRQGEKESEFERIKAGVILGSKRFVEEAKRLIKRISREQPDRKAVIGMVPFEKIVLKVERKSGQKWNKFADRYGDIWRDMVLYLARKRSGLTLREIGKKAGGLEYKAVSIAVSRFASRLKTDKGLSVKVAECIKQL